MDKAITKEGVAVFSGSYMDSLFVSASLRKAGIKSEIKNIIKGTYGVPAQQFFMGTKVLISARDARRAKTIIKEYCNRKEI
ncbi:MAG: hypothetical protein ABIJ16_00915 [Bacteroidota bacterium]